MNTINAFLNSGKDYAKVNIPREMLEKSKAENPLQTFKSGLTNAVKRLKKQNETKVITRKNNVYLITKTYSDKQGWVWKVTRKRK